MDTKSKKAFVLGGTIPHGDLIKKLKSRGYYVYLIDYTDNPPAKKYADQHLQISTLDKEIVLEEARKHEIDLIITTCIDQANCVACYVGEKLGLPIPYSYETSLDATKKGRMKKKFKENGIPTSDYYVIEEDDGSTPKLEFPIVIKPTDANSSKGVFRIDNEEDFHEKIKESFAFSKEKKAIVEKFVKGVEVEAICMAIDGKSKVLITRDYSSLAIDGKELQTSGTMIPGPICDKWKKELEEIAQKIVDAFGLIDTPFFFQALCNENGVNVIEFAPRIAGGATYKMVDIITGFDYMEAALQSFIKEKIEVPEIVLEKKYANGFLYMKPGVFDHVGGIDSYITDGTVLMWFPYSETGKIIDDKISTNNRLGSVMVCGSDYADAKNKLADVMRSLRIFDKEGNDVTLIGDNIL